MTLPRPSRVLFVALTLGRGGAERQLVAMAEALASNGTLCAVAYLEDGPYRSDLEALGTEVVAVGEHPGRHRRMAALVRFARSWEPDVVQASHFACNLYAVVAGVAVRRPAIGAVRSSTRRAVAQLGPLGTPSLRIPRHLAVNSRAAAREAAELGVAPRRLHVLPNVVDVDAFAPPRGARPTDGSPRVLLLGRLEPAKRVDRALRVAELAAARLHGAPAGIEPLHVDVVGDGKLRGDLEQLAVQRHGLDVCFHGEQADVRPFLWGASVLLLTSDQEGTPNAVLEALAAGVPVVATAVGGVPVVVDDPVTGLLHEPGDEEGLAGSLAALLDDPVRAAEMGRAATERVRRTNGPEALEAALDRLYRGVLAQR